MVILRVKISYLATVAVAVLLLVLGHRVATQGLNIFQGNMPEDAAAATVTGIISSEIVWEESDDFPYLWHYERLIFEARITTGSRKGDFVTVVHANHGESPKGLSPGDEIFLVYLDDEWAFDGFKQEVVRATVRSAEIVWVDEDLHHILGDRTILFTAEIRTGQRRGHTVFARQSFAGFVQDASREVAPGDTVLLRSFNDEWFYNGHYRTNRLFWLGILFTVCVLIFGGKKGFNTILSLVLTCAVVFAVFIPSILSGMNIYMMAILVCLYTTIMTLLIVIGFNKKSLAAAVGCISGIAVTGLITVIMDRVLFLTGILDEHSRFLMFLPVEGTINLRAIVFAGIIIGAMGAILDVAMSISSAMWEIKESAGKISFEKLLRSGLTIGRDVFGTMANTLILAYMGTSLSVILILLVYTDSLTSLLNMEMIVVEILQALAGSFGILFTMPLTSFFCSTIFLKDREKVRGS